MIYGNPLHQTAVSHRYSSKFSEVEIIGDSMNTEQKERLERLKRINKEKQYKKKIENDVLLLECKEALGAAGKILEQEEKDAVYRMFTEKVPFLPWGIDWEQFNAFQKISEIDDVCAVLPDTWLFSANYDEVIEFHHDGKITLRHSNSILGD